MSDMIPVDEDDVIDLRQRWQEEDRAKSRHGISRDTRRRAILFGLPALILLVTVLLLITTGGEDGDEGRLEGSAAGSRSRQTSEPVNDPSSTAPATSSATPATIGEGGVTSLPPADPNLPPQETIGYFRGGKLYLEGSVPTVEVANGYLRKAVDVLGAPNVFMNLKLDERSPAGPARVIVEEQFQFPSGSSEIDPKYQTLLAIGAFALERVPESTLVITGYTDDVGDAEANRILSEQRAQKIVDFMVANGIPAHRIIARGRGEADPIADNSTPEGRNKNRRIEGTLEGIMPN